VRPRSRNESHAFNEICFATLFFTLELQQKTRSNLQIGSPLSFLAFSSVR
jgi:hypothetical protein